MRAARAAKDLQAASRDLSDKLAQLFREEVDSFSTGLGLQLSDDTKSWYTEYLKQKVLPLLRCVIRELCSQQPEYPGPFLALALAEQLGCNQPLLLELQTSLQHKKDSEPEPDPGSEADPLTDRNGPTLMVSRSLPDITPPTTTGSRRKSILKSPKVNFLKNQQSSDDTISPNVTTKRRGVSRSTLQLNATPLDLEEIKGYLRRVPMLADLSDKDIERVAAIAQTNVFEVDEPIVTFGQKTDDLHIIAKGMGLISVPQAAGVLREGDFFGEAALQVASKSSHQLTAGGTLGAMTISVNRRAFEELSLYRRNIRREGAVKAGRAVTSDPAGADVSSPRTPKQRGSADTHCLTTGHKLVPGYVQTPEDRQMLSTSLKNSKVLNEIVGLTDEQISVIADSVHLIEVSAGDVVFRKGDIGNALFIVQEGLLKVQLGNNIEVTLRTGDAFGELAILYDEPRSGTIDAVRDCKLWVMPRDSFVEMTQQSAAKVLQEFCHIMSKIPVIAKNVDASLLHILAGMLEETTYFKGDTICLEGEDEGLLYVIYEGECNYLTPTSEATSEQIIQKGDWIGEEQLLNNTAHTRTVIVTSDAVTALALNKSAYELVVGASKDEQMKGKTLEEFQKKLYEMELHRRRKLTRRISFKNIDAARRPINECSVVGALGEGSFGLVLLLRDKEAEVEYALKCLSKEHLQKENQTAMVKNERNVMRLMDSPFVIHLHSSYEDSKFIYFALEVASGGELFDVFGDNNLWGSMDHAKFFAACVSLGLAHIHSRRVIWRDLKLENCLLDHKGYLKLTDMGIAKIVMGKTYTVCGTVDYFAPETLKQVGHNRAADWWALGVLLFIMVAGKSPFDAPEVPQIYRNIIKGFSKVEFPVSFSSEAEELVKALCKKKPEDRITMQRGGVKNLMTLPFFEELQARRATAPYIPPPPDYEKIAARKLSRPVDIQWQELVQWNGDYDQ
jgi:cGMP-dependent protein kinase 1